MDTNLIFLLLMGAACPICMGAMLWLMNKHMQRQSGNLPSNRSQQPVSVASRLAALREQREILETEIAELTEIVELEAQHKALLAQRSTAPDDMPIAAGG